MQRFLILILIKLSNCIIDCCFYIWESMPLGRNLRYCMYVTYILSFCNLFVSAESNGINFFQYVRKCLSFLQTMRNVMCFFCTDTVSVKKNLPRISFQILQLKYNFTPQQRTPPASTIFTTCMLYLMYLPSCSMPAYCFFYNSCICLYPVHPAWLLLGLHMQISFCIRESLACIRVSYLFDSCVYPTCTIVHPSSMLLPLCCC